MAEETLGDFMKRMAACRTEEDAQEFIEAETEHVLELRPELVKEQARSIVMENIGYLTGYYDRADGERMLRLFNARHPVFGGPGEWPKTREEMVELGMKMGEQVKAKRLNA